MRLLKYGIFTLLALITLVLIVMLLLPVERYIPEVEKIVSVLVERPVKISHLKIDLLPAPHLDIDGMAIGAQSEISLGQIEVRFDVPALFHRQCSISQVTISRGSLSEKPVAELFEWLMSPVATTEAPSYCQIQRLMFNNFRLAAPDLPLEGVDGLVLFTTNNDPSLIKLHIPQFELSADITPKPDGSFHVQASSPGWNVPDIPDMKLAQIQASGEISDMGFDIQQISAKLMGISLLGKGVLSWEPEWKLHGDLKVSGAKISHVLSSLDGRTIGFGKLLGDGVFHSSGASLDDVIENIAFDADLKSSDFSLELEPHAAQPLRLDQFNAHIAYTADTIRLQQLTAQLAGGSLTGALTLLPAKSTFRFDLSSQHVNPQPVVRAVDNGLMLSGKLNGNLKGSINLDHLTDFPQESNIEGSFDITQGELGESRLVTAVNSNIPKTEENRIKFDQIRSKVLINNAGYHLSKLKIIASVFNAEGNLNIGTDEQLDGVLETDLKGMAGLISFPLQVSGTLESPFVRPTGGVVAGAALGTALLGPVGTAIGIRAGSLIDHAWQKTNSPKNSRTPTKKTGLAQGKRGVTKAARTPVKTTTNTGVIQGTSHVMPQPSLPVLPE